MTGPSLYGSPLRYAVDVVLDTMTEATGLGALRPGATEWRCHWLDRSFLGVVLEMPATVYGPQGAEFEVVEWVADPLLGERAAFRARRRAVVHLVLAAMACGLLTELEIVEARAAARADGL